MRPIRLLPLAAALVALALWSNPFAQSATGSIAGKVVDAGGGALAGVKVTVSGAPIKAPQTAVTDKNGEFRLRSLPPGRYTFTAELPGFTTASSAVDVTAGAESPLAVTMRIGALSEVLVVTGAGNAPGGVVGGVVGGAPTAPPPATADAVRVGGGAGRGGAAGLAFSAPSLKEFNTETYDRIEESGFRTVFDHPLSTFSIDVDTASYSNVRRFLTEGRLPPPDAVRIEELVNYFRFDYRAPDGKTPFSVTTELAPCPWKPEHRLALIGLQGKPLPPNDPTPRNLVFLLDVSGSMMPANKLPLLRTAMRMLVDTLGARDRIAIVVYAGASGLVLDSTPGDRKDVLHAALARLEAGGSTNGGAGVRLAYKIAREHFIRNGVNRVILATDGDFNVGVTSQGELIRMIEEERSSGVFLSVLGVGTGNLKDSTMEKLADKGNGNYAYLDSLTEARRVLVQEAGGTLVTIAKDVKIQIEFNPEHVAAYRLVGYENRRLQNEDFNNDKKDAGEIGAGHTVTVLYEVVPAGTKTDVPGVDPLKYQQPRQPSSSARGGELMAVKLRYKEPDGETSRLIEVPVRAAKGELTPNLGFAAAVAEFGMLLRESEHKGTATFDEAAALARRFRGTDPEGYRSEFVKLVELAGGLAKLRTTTSDAVHRR
jgi:Ca-activated chloride channel family protein